MSGFGFFKETSNRLIMLGHDKQSGIWNVSKISDEVNEEDLCDIHVVDQSMIIAFREDHAYVYSFELECANLIAWREQAWDVWFLPSIRVSCSFQPE